MYLVSVAAHLAGGGFVKTNIEKSYTELWFKVKSQLELEPKRKSRVSLELETEPDRIRFVIYQSMKCDDKQLTCTLQYVFRTCRGTAATQPRHMAVYKSLSKRPSMKTVTNLKK